MYPSQIAERFNVRMPDGLRERLRISAEMNKRSMNAELVFHLDRALPLYVQETRKAEALPTA
ncbi:Arc family DNA-binding protein [Ochrobactrum intermedium]|uniref:Arc family DNA-binding protein n=1 Tax=Brucella intermedia TaxID=94625 RepID=UPI00159C3059|nr:Arc family DNA-binding protein [Brucella intermedia]